MKLKMNQNNTADSGKSEIIKKFNFVSKDGADSNEILIIELLGGVYSYYTWPSAKVLAQFIFYMRRCIANKKILEIGAGTSLPGILAAKLGANVILSDNAFLSKSLEHIKTICAYNKLAVGSDISVKGLTWGLLGHSISEIGNDLDLVIASDCLYDLSIFEDVISTIALLLEQNQKAVAIISYQLRSSDWSIENLLKKYHLLCRNIDLESISVDCGLDVKDLMEGHSIYLLEIYRNV